MTKRGQCEASVLQKSQYNESREDTQFVKDGKDFRERLTDKLLPAGRVTAHPDGEGALYGRSQRHDRGRCVQQKVSSSWLSYKAALPKGQCGGC